MRIHLCLLSIHLAAVNLPAQTWQAINLHPKGASSSAASGTTATKQAGYANFFGNSQPVIWSGTSTSFKNLNPPGIGDSAFNCLTSTRQGGSAFVAGEAHAGVWSFTPGSFVDLHPIGAAGSAVRAMQGTQQGGYVYFTTLFGPYNAAIWNGTAASHVNLHPAGAYTSEVLGIGGGLQVGRVAFPRPSRNQAAIWTGTAASYINMHPAGASESEINATTGIQHAGFATFALYDHALLWNDVTPDAFTDLHPAGVRDSTLLGIFGSCQSGFVEIQGGARRAGFWKGSPESFVNLHTFLPGGYAESVANSVWTDGRLILVSGWARSAAGRTEAILWKWDPDARPTLKITGDRLKTITGPNTVLRGIANDVNRTLGGVEVKVGGKAYVRARGKARWRFPVRGLDPGITRVFIRAYTKSGIRSRPFAITIRRR